MILCHRRWLRKRLQHQLEQQQETKATTPTTPTSSITVMRTPSNITTGRTHLFLFLLLQQILLLTAVEAHIYVEFRNDYAAPRIVSSVSYFDWKKEIQQPLSSSSSRPKSSSNDSSPSSSYLNGKEIYYANYKQPITSTTAVTTSSTSKSTKNYFPLNVNQVYVTDDDNASHQVDDDDDAGGDGGDSDEPDNTIMIVSSFDFDELTTYGRGQTALDNLSTSAQTFRATFIVLLLSGLDWKAKVQFWWSHCITYPSVANDAWSTLLGSNNQLNLKRYQRQRHITNSDNKNKNNNETLIGPFFVVVIDNDKDILHRIQTEKYVEQFGVDDESPLKGRTVTFRIAFCCIVLYLVFKVWTWMTKTKKNGLQNMISSIRQQQQQQQQQQFTSNPATEEAGTGDISFHFFSSEDLGRGQIREGPCSTTTVCHSNMKNFSTKKPSHDDYHRGNDNCCAICLGIMPKGTTVSILPCRHTFHPRCIDELLRQPVTTNNNNNNFYNSKQWCCPLCQFDLHQYFEERHQAQMNMFWEIGEAADADADAQVKERTVPRMMLVSRWLHRYSGNDTPPPTAWLSWRSSSTAIAVTGEMGDLELTVNNNDDNNNTHNHVTSNRCESGGVMI